MRVKKSSIVAFVMLGAIFGYPLVAGISATLGLPNTIVSFSLRAAVALLGVFLILDNLNSHPTGLRRKLIFYTCLFISLYIWRLAYSTLLSPTMSTSAAINYWAWAVGSVILPVLGLSLAKNYNLNWPALYKSSVYITFFASVLVAMNMSTSVTNATETYDSGRARLDTLNPISLGHLGASLLLLSIAAFWQPEIKRSQRTILAIVGIAVGGSLVVASNSRGPIVSAAAALSFAWLVQRGRDKVTIALILAIAAWALVPVLMWFENSFGFTTYSRLFGQSFDEEVNVIARIDMYTTALRAFMNSPFFGAGLEIDEIGFYPHNVTLEAFLAVGIFGGLAFVAIQALTLTLTWKISRARNDLIWISMIVIQYVTAAQFSGALYASPSFWAAIGIAAFAFSVISPAPTEKFQSPRKTSFAS